MPEPAPGRSNTDKTVTTASTDNCNGRTRAPSCGREGSLPALLPAPWAPSLLAISGAAEVGSGAPAARPTAQHQAVLIAASAAEGRAPDWCPPATGHAAAGIGVDAQAVRHFVEQFAALRGDAAPDRDPRRPSCAPASSRSRTSKAHRSAPHAREREGCLCRTVCRAARSRQLGNSVGRRPRARHQTVGEPYHRPRAGRRPSGVGHRVGSKVSSAFGCAVVVAESQTDW